jgi:predicted phosphohydrolase
MSIYAIGDTHLSLNEKVEKPMDIFGPEWENHAEKLKTEWEKTVGEEDVVIICGDISWALRLPEAMSDLDFIHDLPGKKVLLKGNHDLWWASIKKLNGLYDDLYFLQNDFYPSDNVAICGSRGWVCPGSEEFTSHDRKIYDRELIRMRMSLESAQLAGFGKQEKGIIIGVMHYPPTNDSQEDSGFTELFQEYGVKTVVYGHLHNGENHKKGLKGMYKGVEYKLVAFDYIKGKPVKLI